MVISVWCPTAEIIGIFDEWISRATNSLLNDHKSSIEPPPRHNIRASTSFLWFAILRESIIPCDAALPWTGVGYTIILKDLFRLPKVVITSLNTEASGYVITPIQLGWTGKDFFLSSSKRPSESNFCLSLLNSANNYQLSAWKISRTN